MLSLAIASCSLEDKERAIAFIIVGCFFIGWNESVCLSNSGIELLDQREIGTAVGAAGSIRSAISSISSAVYLTVLSNRLTTTIPAVVPPALTAAGLPEASVPAFLTGLTTGSFTGVEGLTDSILAAGTQAYKVANAQAYSTVFYTTIAFTGTAVIISFFSPNVDDKMTRDVAVTLNREEDAGIVE
jgi:Fungal trichothecene efflux pump (TRI12)